MGMAPQATPVPADRGGDGYQILVGQFHHFCHFFGGAGEYHHFRLLEEMGVPFFIGLVLFQILFIGLYIPVPYHFFQFFHQFRRNRVILVFHFYTLFPVYCNPYVFSSFSH